MLSSPLGASFLCACAWVSTPFDTFGMHREHLIDVKTEGFIKLTFARVAVDKGFQASLQSSRSCAFERLLLWLLLYARVLKLLFGNPLKNTSGF